MLQIELSLVFLGKGQNVENHFVQSQKRTSKVQKEHRKSKKNIKNQSVESLFFKLIKTSKMKSLIRTSKISTSKRTSKVKNDFRRSDFTYGVKKDQNVENQKIIYLLRITYVYQGL
jgi:hypothetical protein